jgi:hypothetical protein
LCAPGTYSGAGAEACIECDPGEYTGETGATACLRCSTEKGKGYWSSEGAAECDQAAQGYFMNTKTKEPEECLEGIECNEAGLTSETMVIDKGFYRFSTSATVVYLCMANCEGSSRSSSDSSDSSDSSGSTDRRRRCLSFETDTECKSGSHGPLCSLCDTDHYLVASTGICRPCVVDWMAPVFGLLVLIAMCTALVLARQRIGKWTARNKAWLPNFTEKVVIFIITMQIIFILKSNHTSVGGAEMTEPYASFVELISVVDLDLPRLLPFNCLTEREWDHFDSLVSVTATPIFLFISGSGLVQTKHCKSTARDSNQAHGRFRYYFIRVMLLAYPAISRTICQSFRCDEYDGGDTYGEPKLLKADLSIDCDGVRYEPMVAYAALTLLIYSIGIPLVLFLKLYKWRRELNPSKYEDEERAIKARLKAMRKNKAMLADPIVKLALPFRPRYWWYEVFSLGRRFTLTSLVLAFNHWHSATAYTVLVLLLAHILEREWSPLIDPFMGNFSHGLSWQIVMSVIYMLFLDSGVLNGPDAVWYSVGLLVFNVGLMGVLGQAALAGIEKLKQFMAQLKVLNAQLVIDKQEDMEKFAAAWYKLIETGGEGDEAGLLEALRTLAQFSALPNGKQPTPKQSSTLANVDALIEQAEEVAPRFHAFLRALVKERGGEYLQGPNKSRARAMEKIEGDYGGDHTKLVDVVRASAIFTSFRQLGFFAEALLEEGCTLIVVRAKDRFNAPLDSGYRDMLLNVKLEGTEHVGELQLHLRTIIDIKEAAHRTYALMRSVGWEDDSLEGEDGEEEEEEEAEVGSDSEVTETTWLEQTSWRTMSSALAKWWHRQDTREPPMALELTSAINGRLSEVGQENPIISGASGASGVDGKAKMSGGSAAEGASQKEMEGSPNAV